MLNCEEVEERQDFGFVCACVGIITGFVLGMIVAIWTLI